MPQNISGVNWPNVYRLGSLVDLKQNQFQRLKVVIRSPNEKDFILQNGYKSCAASKEDGAKAFLSAALIHSSDLSHESQKVAQQAIQAKRTVRL
uniref:Uncharacterized protein n=1 Tax=Schistosoma mansoni TaxID=6183 RepID=A0A3Q0KTR5_SCHMA